MLRGHKNSRKWSSSPSRSPGDEEGHVGADLCWLLGSASWVVSSWGPAGRKGLFCYELGEGIDLRRCLTTGSQYITHAWRLESWRSFSKVTEASECPTVHQLLHTPLLPSPAYAFFSPMPAACPTLQAGSLSPCFPLTNENCFGTMLRERFNGTHLGIHSQISAAWIQLLS